jgi:hypothetical protein
MRATKSLRYLSRRISRPSQKNARASPSSTFHANSTAKPPAGQRAVGRRKLADLPLDCHQSNRAGFCVHSDCSRCADRTVERVQQKTVILSAGLRADAQAMNKELPLRSTVKGGETDCPEYPRVEHVLVLARQARRRAGKCPTDSGSRVGVRMVGLVSREQDPPDCEGMLDGKQRPPRLLVKLVMTKLAESGGRTRQSQDIERHPAKSCVVRAFTPRAFLRTSLCQLRAYPGMFSAASAQARRTHSLGLSMGFLYRAIRKTHQRPSLSHASAACAASSKTLAALACVRNTPGAFGRVEGPNAQPNNGRSKAMWRTQPSIAAMTILDTLAVRC